MTVAKKQILPALHNSGKVENPDLPEIGDKNYTATILKYANLALPFPQLETDAKTIVAAINESQVVANPEIPAEPESLSSIQIKDTVYTIYGGGGGTTVIPNPSGTPTDTLNTVKIDNTIYDVGSSGPAITLAELQDTDINSPANREYLTYDAGDKKWKNTDINSLLTATTRGQYCNFYTPLSAGLLNCRVYAGLRVEPGTPTPNSSRFPIRYSTLAVGSCSNSGSYSYYLSGLFRTLGFEGCTWYLDLGSLSWYYEDGVFKTQGYYFNTPKKNFICICNNHAYTYKGSDTSYADKTIGYWSPYEIGSSFWVRDDQFNGNVSEFTSNVSGIYVLYESIDNDSSISINNYNMLLSKFNLDGWAIKVSYVDLTQDMYAGEWDVVNKCMYYTWAVRSQTDMLSGYTINNQYVIYDASEWDFRLKPDCDAFCTNFAFEPDTETPSVNCFSVHNNTVIFNIASLQSSWSDWIQFNTTFKLHYETSDVATSYLYYFDMPATYKTMNFMWSNVEGDMSAQYYSGDATAYINFTNAVISSAELGNLDNVDISGVQDGEVLKYNSTSGKWENNADLNTPDYEDLSNKPMINGHVLIGNQSGEDLGLGGGGGGGGDISVKNFQADNSNVNASYAKYFEIGSLVFIDCLFSITGSISSGTVMFSGLPSSAYQIYLVGASNNSSLNRFYTENGHIYAAMTFSSNARTYHIFGSYLKS